MNKWATQHISFNKVISTLWLIILLCGISPRSYTQIRSGAAFLKILPGSRQQGMAGSLTGAIDELQSLYANPAATGFLREWEMSGTYTKWMADIYNISLNYGKNIPTFWSRSSRLVIGLNYLGVKEFDSTLRTRPSVAANDLLLVFSLGNPLNFISENFSVGANVKYLQSQLAEFSARSIIYDLGFLAKTNRFNLISGLGDYAILSGGVAVTQLGSSLNFKAIATPLPRTWRAGAALNIGAHDGLQIQLTADYQLVRDEIGSFSLGSEISWSYRFAVRGGYNFNDKLLSKLSLGFSVRLDDHSTLINKKMAGNNNALRSDLASLENNEFFSASYRGTVNYYPIGPEKFELTHPVNHDTLESGETTFAWEMARDADLYDEVNYYLLLERVFKADIQNSHLYSLLENSQKNGYDLQRLIQQARAELFLVKNSDFNFNASENQASLTIQKLPAGDYYWTIIAYDRDDHYRINTNGLRSFIILWPDLRIKKLEFDPLPWITENDTQGVISAQIENSGEIKAENILVTVLSSLITKNYPAVTPPIIHQACIPELNAHEIYRLPFNWLEANSGSYQIQVRANVIEPDNKIGREGNLANNVGSTIFHTIPKGRFTSQDTAIAFIYPWTRYDVPFVNRIFFDLNSSEVKPSYYYDSEWLYPPFRILAERLNKRTDIFLQLEGFADTSKKESLEIAKRRAESVRNILLMLGVNAQQLPLTGLSWQLSLARKITANEDVQEERRFVRLIPTRFDNGQTDNSLLEPVPFETIQQQPVSLPVIFRNTIGGIIPIQNGELRIQSSGTAASLIFTYSKTAQDTVAWVPTQLAGSIWLNNNVSYQIVMTDTLQRQFKTRPKAVHLKKLNTYLPSVVGLAEFNDPIPFPIIPLEKLFHELRIRFTYDKKVRFRFIGHACGIPPQPVNDRYSNLRAQLFQEIFLRELEKQKDIEPQLYHLISDRLDQKGAMGYSSFQPYKCVVAQERLSEHKKHFNNGSYEKILQSVYQENGKVMKPFIFKRQGGEISLVGDNETPEGRHINRRIEIELFIPNGKFVDLIPASKLK